MPELVHGRCGDPAAYDADRFGGLAAGILWRELADKTPGGREVIELPQRFLQLCQRIDVVRRSRFRIQRREEFDRVAQLLRRNARTMSLRWRGVSQPPYSLAESLVAAVELGIGQRACWSDGARRPRF